MQAFSYFGVLQMWLSLKLRTLPSSESIILDFLYSPVKGVFSFSFRVDSDIAPAAQLLVYAILPNGEIVADTEKLEIENCFANKVGLLWKQFSYSSPFLKDVKEEIVSI